MMKSISFSHVYSAISAALWLFICFACNLHAQVLDETHKGMQQAAALFEAKQYRQAEELYQNILQEPLATWQRAIALSNLGYALLADQKWEEAINTFKIVPLEHNLSTLTIDRVTRGIALTHLYEALATKESSKRIDLLRQALVELNQAVETHCALEKAEGQTPCIPDKTLNTYIAAAHYELALALQREEQEKLAHLSLREGLSLLKQGVEYLASQLKLIEYQQLENPLKERYISVNAKDGKSLVASWSILKTKLQDTPQENKNITLFDGAAAEYQIGLNHLEKSHVAESSHSFEKSAAILKDLIDTLPPPPPTTAPTPPPPSSKHDEQPQDQQPQNASIEEVLRLLMQMEQTDASRSSPQPILNKELRPW